MIRGEYPSPVRNNERHFKIEVPEDVDSKEFIQKVLATIARTTSAVKPFVCEGEGDNGFNEMPSPPIPPPETEEELCTESSEDCLDVLGRKFKPKDDPKSIKKKHKDQAKARKALQKECNKKAKEIMREFKLKEKHRQKKEKERLARIQRFEKQKDKEEKKCRKERKKCEKDKEKVRRAKEKEKMRTLQDKMKRKCDSLRYARTSDCEDNADDDQCCCLAQSKMATQAAQARRMMEKSKTEWEKYQG
ncbi:hypothetical protein M8J77_025067 [Diaphorina citri]|nr:hypothetical protein M8J77_025067 [Diaphorina citri]